MIQERKRGKGFLQTRGIESALELLWGGEEGSGKRGGPAGSTRSQGSHGHVGP